MNARPKFNFFLIHQETGQRYPVGEEVVLGRTSGDILFPDDPKVSNQHCRILKTPKGLAIHDLESSNGTFIDDTRLDPKKVYAFKSGNTVAIGGQELKLQAAPKSKTLKKKRRRRKKNSFDTHTAIAVGIALVAGVILAKFLPFGGSRAPEFVGAIESPREIVEREMRQAFKEYTEIGKAHTSGKITDKELRHSLRQKLLPKLTTSRAQMDVLRPQTEWEKRKIETNKKLLSALIGQVSAMASYSETQLARYQHEVEKFGDDVEKLSREAQKLDETRRPANY